MTNTYIANGTGTRDDLIRDIKLGIYACDAQGGQTYLEDFSFTAGHGYMIRDGQLAELVKDVVIAGNLFQTMDRIDRIAGDFQWNEMGGGCGKGGQAPAARHRRRAARTDQRGAGGRSPPGDRQSARAGRPPGGGRRRDGQDR